MMLEMELKKNATTKVNIENSCGEGSLMEQDTIENAFLPIFF